uniref:Uncharacterized protein n=1 Tax=Anguilla anguilla TaxID=7936 RepID=A0A0E9PMM3_ANGAN
MSCDFVRVRGKTYRTVDLQEQSLKRPWCMCCPAGQPDTFSPNIVQVQETDCDVIMH